ncbi:MAG: hypothetical protein ACQEXJ_01165 [Myxococcota bacterium]
MDVAVDLDERRRSSRDAECAGWKPTLPAGGRHAFPWDRGVLGLARFHDSGSAGEDAGTDAGAPELQVRGLRRRASSSV